MSVYYTYLWCRQDGSPYYVGKGKGTRANRKGSPKDLDCIIIQEHYSEKGALEAEKLLISFYGRKDLDLGILRNRTDGGEGVSGLKKTLSLEQRQRISKANFGRKQGPHAESHLRNMSAARKGIPWTDARWAASGITCITKIRMATCHPERKHRAIGLCGPCYKSSWKLRAPKPTRMAICHPDRLYQASGLCNICYQIAYRQSTRRM